MQSNIEYFGNQCLSLGTSLHSHCEEKKARFKLKYMYLYSCKYQQNGIFTTRSIIRKFLMHAPFKALIVLAIK